MVIFDTLQVSKDAKELLVEAHINQDEHFNSYEITDIFINTDEDFLESGVNEEKAIYHKEYSEKPNSIKETIEGDFESHLLFIYIRVAPREGEDMEGLPCNLESIDVLGVTFNLGLLYNAGLTYIKELSNTCAITQGFSDFILQWEGFKILLGSKHYIDAVRIFNRLFKKNTKVKTNHCNCHGTVFTKCL